MIEMRHAQLSFGDGLIAEEVSDLRDYWMAAADRVLERFRLDVNRNSNRGFRWTCKSDSGCSDCNDSGVARWPGDIRTT